jgi:hypothetical protein
MFQKGLGEASAFSFEILPQPSERSALKEHCMLKGSILELPLASKLSYVPYW